VDCLNESLWITLSGELEHLTAIGQRLIVEPITNARFFFCEKPTAKATKGTSVLLGSGFAEPALDEGPLKPRNKGSIHGIKRLLPLPYHNPS
ncbi:hypothetical protein, partial [Bradyrhizobium ottawaense]|uniref:hypothetical protein n=1 Tax=Bradyrhizobium ottawaense TaxID=931866 RepID=UPI0030C7585C